MPVRRRTRTAAQHFRPPLPPELAVYEGANWGAPSLDGGGNAWEAAHRAAYMRFEEAFRRWFTEFGHLAVDPSASPADEPFCGAFDHACGGRGCRLGPSMDLGEQQDHCGTPTAEKSADQAS
jgi:hypothetical protein